MTDHTATLARTAVRVASLAERQPALRERFEAVDEWLFGVPPKSKPRPPSDNGLLMLGELLDRALNHDLELPDDQEPFSELFATPAAKASGIPYPTRGDGRRHLKRRNHTDSNRENLAFAVCGLAHDLPRFAYEPLVLGKWSRCRIHMVPVLLRGVEKLGHVEAGREQLIWALKTVEAKAIALAERSPDDYRQQAQKSAGPSAGEMPLQDAKLKAEAYEKAIDGCDPEDERRPPALTPRERVVLLAMASFDRDVLATVAQVRQAFPRIDRPSESTIKPAIRKLIAEEYAERPEGPKCGARLTNTGYRRAAKLRR